MRFAPALVLALALALAACSFRGDFDGTHYRCGAEQQCHAGSVCSAGVCSPPDQPDAAVDAGASTRCSSLALLRDDFEATTLARRWRTYAVGTQTIAPTDGALRITAPAGDNWGGVDSRAYYDFTDSELEATVVAVGGWTGIEVIAADSQRLQLFAQDGVLTAEVWSGNAKTVRATAPYDPVAHRRWRLRAAGADVIWETSPDGSTWTPLWSEPAPFDVAYVHGRVSAGAGSTAVDARFAEINLDAIATTGQCAASTIHDDLATLSPTFAAFTATDCTVDFPGTGVAITSNAGSVNNCGLVTRRLFDLSAGAIFVDAARAVSGPSHIAYLRAAPEDSASARIEIERADGLMRFVQIAPDGTEATRVEVPYDDQMRYWQLRADGGVARLAVSPDAISFTPYTNATLAFDATAVRISLGASHTDTQGSAVTASFDGVNVP